MTTFVVLKSPRSDVHQAIKRGFNWPAFFFPLFWAIVYRIPRSGYSAYMLFVSLLGSSVLIGMAARLSTPDSPLLITILSVATSLAAGIVGGRNGNDWHVRRLQDEHWQHVGVQEAKSAYDAIQAVRKSTPAES